MPKSKKKIVEITVEGGIVDVMKLPRGVGVIIRDFDTDGCDLDEYPEMKVDEESGDYYFEKVY